MTGPLSTLAELFRQRFGTLPERSEPVSADGSARRYWRLWGPGGETAIGAFGPEPEENRAFLSFSRTFCKLDLPVPEIYAADEEAGVWLEEDLGDRTCPGTRSRAVRPGQIVVMAARHVAIAGGEAARGLQGSASALARRGFAPHPRLDGPTHQLGNGDLLARGPLSQRLELLFGELDLCPDHCCLHDV